ncbi:MAG: hypothetical protein ACXWQE_14610, partial [Bdellovibrionales bacterium]
DDDKTETATTVNGKEASEYYSAFMGDDPQIYCVNKTKQSTFSSTWLSAEVTNASLQVELYYTGGAEIFVTVPGSQPVKWAGYWRIVGTNLILGDSFILSGVKYQGSENLVFTIKPGSKTSLDFLMNEYIVLRPRNVLINCGHLSN